MSAANSPECNHFLRLPAIAHERHVLDESYVDVFVACQLNKVTNLTVIEAVHHNTVDFRFVAQLNGQIDASQYSLEAFAARDCLIFASIQCVQTDVDGIESGTLHRHQQSRQH